MEANRGAEQTSSGFDELEEALRSSGAPSGSNGLEKELEDLLGAPSSSDSDDDSTRKMIHSRFALASDDGDARSIRRSKTTAGGDAEVALSVGWVRRGRTTTLNRKMSTQLMVTLSNKGENLLHNCLSANAAAGDVLSVQAPDGHEGEISAFAKISRCVLRVPQQQSTYCHFPARSIW